MVAECGANNIQYQSSLKKSLALHMDYKVSEFLKSGCSDATTTAIAVLQKRYSVFLLAVTNSRDKNLTRFKKIPYQVSDCVLRMGIPF